MSSFFTHFKEKWRQRSLPQKIISLFLISQLIGIPLGIIGDLYTNTAWLKDTTHIKIRYANDFSLKDGRSIALFNKIKGLSNEFTTISIDDPQLLFGEEPPRTHIDKRSVQTARTINKTVIMEIDFFNQGEKLGTIKALTPSDSHALKRMQEGENPSFWKDCLGMPIVFYKNGKYFTFSNATVIEENLALILSQHLFN